MQNEQCFVKRSHIAKEVFHAHLCLSYSYNIIKPVNVVIFMMLMSIIKHFTTGYMDKQLFKQWFEKIFLKHCGRDRPIVLLLDNHYSHLSYDVLDMAMQNEVKISFNVFLW